MKPQISDNILKQTEFFYNIIIITHSHTYNSHDGFLTAPVSSLRDEILPLSKLGEKLKDNRKMKSHVKFDGQLTVQCMLQNLLSNSIF